MPHDDILLLERIHDAAETELKRDGLTVRRVDRALAPEELAEHLAEVRMVGIRSKTHITEDVMIAAPHLEAIGCFCIGTNQVDLDAAARRGITVFNSPFSNTRSVAEMTLAEIIALHTSKRHRRPGQGEGQAQEASSDRRCGSPAASRQEDQEEGRAAAAAPQ